MIKGIARLPLSLGLIGTFGVGVGVGVAAVALPIPARAALIGAVALALLAAWHYGPPGGLQPAVGENWNRSVLRSKVTQELSRARRTDSHVVLAVVSLEGDPETRAAAVEAATNVVRLHDLVGHDQHRNEVNLVAVVPNGAAAAAFGAKVTREFGAAGVRCASAGAEATSAAELLAQLDGVVDTATSTAPVSVRQPAA